MHEGPQDARHVLGLSGVLGRAGRSFGFGACRERERLADEVQRAVVGAQDELRVDEPLECTGRRSGVEAGVGAQRLERRRAEHEGGDDAAPIVVREQPDQLPGLEQRFRHGR